jgi:hypothetical protein
MLKKIMGKIIGKKNKVEETVDDSIRPLFEKAKKENKLESFFKENQYKIKNVSRELFSEIIAEWFSVPGRNSNDILKYLLVPVSYLGLIVKEESKKYLENKK